MKASRVIKHNSSNKFNPKKPLKGSNAKRRRFKSMFRRQLNPRLTSWE